MKRLICWITCHDFDKILKFQEGFFEHRRTVVIWECKCCKKREIQIIEGGSYRII